jgi:hypothetical protein
MVKTLLLLILIGLTTVVQAATPTDQQREWYGTKIYEAFQMQAQGQTREAYYHFKKAYDDAINLGEDRKKLFSLNELFIWYRKYGYSLGITIQPSNCTGEIKERTKSSRAIGILGTNKGYQSEWGKDPIQAGKIRDVVFGFGEIISSVLMITIGTPPVKAFGLTVGWDGFNRIWSACNGLYVDQECDALKRLREIESQAKKIKSYP